MRRYHKYVKKAREDGYSHFEIAKHMRDHGYPVLLILRIMLTRDLGKRLRTAAIPILLIAVLALGGRAAVVLDATTGGVSFNTSGVERMVIDDQGRVGIGLVDPNELLHVAGNINVTSGNDICIEEDICLSQAGTGSGDVTDVLTGVGLNVTNPGGPQPKLDLNLTYTDNRYVNAAGDTTGALTSDLNIDSDTFVISYDDNNIGIGINTPGSPLEISLDGVTSGHAFRISATDSGAGDVFLIDKDGDILTSREISGSYTYSTSTGGVQDLVQQDAFFSTADTGKKITFHPRVSSTRSSGDLEYIISMYAQTDTSSAGNVTNAVGVWSDMLGLSTGTISHGYRYYAAEYIDAGSSTIQNQYGYYVEELTEGTQNNYAIYTEGSTKSYFGGNVGINTSSPQFSLDIMGDARVDGVRNPVVESIWNGTGMITTPESVAVSGSYAYLAGYDSDSMVVVDISDPSNISYVGVWDPQNTSMYQRGDLVDVAGKYAFVTGYWSHSMVVVDISDPSNPAEVGVWDADDSGVMQYTSSLNIVGKYAYITGFNSDNLVIIDISDPSNPTMVGNWDPVDLDLIDSIRGAAVQGKYAYVVGANSDTLVVVDISDPSSPQTVSNWTSPDTNLFWYPYSVDVSGSYAYVAAYNSDNLVIFDISNATQPKVVGNWTPNDTAIMDGSLHVTVEGKYAYISGYTSNNLAIVDVSDPTAPKLVSLWDPNDLSVLDNIRMVEISGKYGYVVSKDTNSLSVLDLGGIETPNLEVGALQTHRLHATDDARVDNGLYVGNSINVGYGGIHTDGTVSASGSQDNYFAGNLGLGTNTPNEQLTVVGNINLTGTIKTDSACGVPSAVLWAEENGALSTATASGLQFSFGNGGTGNHGPGQVCSGTVVAMSMTCANSGATTGKVQMAVNGAAQGTGCQVSSPNSANGVSTDTSCSISFSANDKVTPITTTSDATTTNCVVTYWMQYD